MTRTLLCFSTMNDPSTFIRGCQGLALALVLAWGVCGCGSKGATDATGDLEVSFQAERPEVQRAVQQVAAELRAGNVPQAVRLLIPVLENRKLTEAQEQAVGATIKQINDAIAADPNLQTAEMYQVRQKLFRSVYDQGGF
jgi:hypothetical protein